MKSIILDLMDQNLLPKNLRADLPYSDKDRLKAILQQTLVVLIELLEPEVYTPEFRQLRVQLTGRDIISEFNNRLCKIFGLTHVKTIRQYIEIASIKFTLQYPELSIENPLFLKTLLDPNIKRSVAASFLTTAEYILNSPLAGSNEILLINLKLKIFQHMAGFLTFKSAHARCVAQYFLGKLVTDLKTAKASLTIASALITQRQPCWTGCSRVSNQWQTSFTRIIMWSR